MEILRFSVFFFCFFLCLLSAFTANGIVLLKGKNTTVSFEDIEANFAPPVKGSGIHGTLYVANPSDACSILTNKVVRKVNQTESPFVLITRGGCSFDDKVRRAQAAGFKAAIVYNNENGYLVAMAGSTAGIKIHAVFVSKPAGEKLLNYAGAADVELWVFPSFGNTAWSIMAVSFIALLAMSAVLATCFFVRRHRIRREQPQDLLVREFHGMSSRLVKALPSLIFTVVTEDNCTSSTCAICLEDYNMGEKLRILPCRHKFHATCVDAWLTTWRTFCPVCKRDARTIIRDPLASESTPLLSSTPAKFHATCVDAWLTTWRTFCHVCKRDARTIIRDPLASESTPLLSSTPASVTSSDLAPAIQISRPSSSRSSFVSRPESFASTSYNLHSHHNQYSHMSTSRSSVDLRTMSPQRSNGTYLVSPHSLGYPSPSSLNSRYMSPYIPSLGNGSLSYAGSSSRQANPLHYSESASSFSPYASAQSLPDC